MNKAILWLIIIIALAAVAWWFWNTAKGPQPNLQEGALPGGGVMPARTLDLANNKLTGLPNELSNLQKLKTLNLSGNAYSQKDLDYIKSRLPATTQIILKR
jgi:hypothetical protein